MQYYEIMICFAHTQTFIYLYGDKYNKKVFVLTAFWGEYMCVCVCV